MKFLYAHIIQDVIEEASNRVFHLVDAEALSKCSYNLGNKWYLLGAMRTLSDTATSSSKSYECSYGILREPNCRAHLLITPDDIECIYRGKHSNQDLSYLRFQRFARAASIAAEFLNMLNMLNMLRLKG